MSLTAVLSLVQDFALVEPLLRRARGRTVTLLAAERLAVLPGAGERLNRLAADAGARLAVFPDTATALAALNEARGLVIFPSESRSPHHRPTHALASALPSRFVSATLQHGYECIGFLHNRAHERTREDAGFAADIVCGWFGPERLTALPPWDRAKLMTTGSTLFLDDGPAAWLSAVVAGEPAVPRVAADGLLVCENLQSPRLAGAARVTFLEALSDLARTMPVTVRPHPAGPFARGEIEPPPGVVLDARPVAEAGLHRYGAAISPPSTVLFDLMARDVPVAVWRDPHGLVDDANYGALPRVTGAAEWRAFLAAAQHPATLERQRAFVRSLGFPGDTRGHFDALLALSDEV